MALMSLRVRPSWLACLLLLAPAAARAAEPGPLEFHLTFDRRVSDAPFWGRVYVMLSKDPVRDLRSGPNWFRPEPSVALAVKGWRPGQTLVVGTDALACPVPLAKVPKGTYSVVAVMDFDPGERSFSTADGHGHSKPARLELDPAATGPVALAIDQVFRARRFPESARVKLVEVESQLLSVFHGRPVKVRAAVTLPKSFEKERDRRYPVVYEIPGFGGDHYGAVFAAAANKTDVAGVEMLYVVLSPSCRNGHH